MPPVERGSYAESQIGRKERPEAEAWFAEQYNKGAFKRYEQKGATRTIIVGHHFLTLDDKGANRFLKQIYLEHVAKGNYKVVQPATVAVDAGDGKNGENRHLSTSARTDSRKGSLAPHVLRQLGHGSQRKTWKSKVSVSLDRVRVGRT